MNEGLETSTNIVELWNKNIFDSLMKVQEYLRVAQDGSSSIQEFVQVNPADIPILQFQYVKQAVTELAHILLPNVKIKLPKKFYDDSQKELDNALKIIEVHPEKIITQAYDQANQTRTWQVTELLYKIIKVASEIREETVVKLSDILFGVDESGSNKKKW